jgi:hypothetical protein
MAKVPSFMLKALYQRDSLHITGDGFTFQINNGLGPVRLIGLLPLRVNRKAVPLAQCSLVHGDQEHPAEAISAENSLLVRKGDSVTVQVRDTALRPGRHNLDIGIVAKDLGELRFSVSDRARRASNAPGSGGSGTQMNTEIS